MGKLLFELVLPEEERPKFTFVSGKGGVGKSSMAAATAVWLADQGHNTLLVSLDLQKSQNDIFQQDIKFSETSISGVPSLKAITIETAESISYHKGDIIKTLEVVDPSSPVLRQIKEEMKSACGCEIASLYVFTEYLNNKTYDAVVFDTAPTGHTLEDITNQINYTLSLTQQIKAREKLAKTLGESKLKEQTEKLKEYENLQRYAIENLRSRKTSFVMTILPEALPLLEAERSIEALEQVYKVPVRGIIINEIIPESERYTSDFWKSRWAMQNKYIELTYQKFPGKVIAQVPLLDSEVIGLDRIRRIGKALYG